MGKEKMRYGIILKDYPAGHGFRRHAATTKKGAHKLGKKLSQDKGYTVRKFKKPWWG